MRRLTDAELADLRKKRPDLKTCGIYGCKRKFTHWNEFTDPIDSEVFCNKHAKEDEELHKKYPNYPPKNPDGSIKLPDCLVEAKRKLMVERHKRAEQLKTEAMGPWLRSMFLNDVAHMMQKLNISEEAARYKLHRQMGIRHDIAVELSKCMRGYRYTDRKK